MNQYKAYQTKYSDAAGAYETLGIIGTVEGNNAQDALYAAEKLPDTLHDFIRPIKRAVQRVYKNGKLGEITFAR